MSEHAMISFQGPAQTMYAPLDMSVLFRPLRLMRNITYVQVLLLAQEILPKSRIIVYIYVSNSCQCYVLFVSTDTCD